MNEQDADDRKTLPPSPATEPPPSFNPLPSEALKRLDGFDPDQFLHAALLAAADSAHEARESRKADAEKNRDIAALLEAAVSRLDSAAETRSAMRTAEISANFELARHEVQRCLGAVEELRERVGELGESVRSLAPRVGTVESTVDRLQDELTTLRTDLYRRVTHLEQEVRALQGKGPTIPPSLPTMPSSRPRKTNPGK